MRDWKKRVVSICGNLVSDVKHGPLGPTLVIVIIAAWVGFVVFSAVRQFGEISRNTTTSTENTNRLNTVLEDLNKTTVQLGITIDQLAVTIDALDAAMDMDEKNLAELDEATKKLEENVDKLRPEEKP